MAEINILDSSIFNRIAAGEVVESPMSIVKELVENSIDAGAKNIVVEIKSGGIDSIRVTDDGKGLSHEDLPLAFLPHATSKIKTIDDLNNIGTLGFRGEALPSIASVANITMLSRTADNDIGYCIQIENGKIIAQGEAGAPLGTTVEVKDLFKNVPARKKFLKKPSAEASAITGLIQKTILANPEKNIKYIVDNKVIFHSSNSGTENAIYTVYGDTLNNLDYINSIMPDITLLGYVSKPSFSKHNKTFQTLIVNGRVVENDDVSYWIYLCYQEYLMKRQYPMYILYLNVPLDMVDVNVHPNKLNIKFADVNRIKNIITGAIKKSINKQMLYPQNLEAEIFDVIDSEASAAKSPQIKSDILFNSKNSDFSQVASDFKNNVYKNNENSVVQERRFNRAQNDFLNIKTNLDQPITESANIKQESISDFQEAQIIAGKLFNTYLIVQKGSCVYLIDQHAAHEKILFDKYIKYIDEKNIAVQDLLIPYVFYVDSSEQESIESALNEVNALGFSISPFGENSFSISGVPLICSNINLKSFVPLLIEAIEAKKIRSSDFLRDSIAQSACKAAVKGADDLSKIEIESLLSEMEKNGGALFCPHGRPTIVKLNKSEIEKWFKRI